MRAKKKREPIQRRLERVVVKRMRSLDAMLETSPLDPDGKQGWRSWLSGWMQGAIMDFSQMPLRYVVPPERSEAPNGAAPPRGEG